MGKEKLPIDVMNFGWPDVDSKCFVSPYSHIIGEVVVRGKVIIMANVFIAGDKCCPVEISPGVFIGEDVKIFGRNNGKGGKDQEEILIIAFGCHISPSAFIFNSSLGDSVYVGCGVRVINSMVSSGCYIGHGSIIEGVKVPSGRSIPNNTTINRQDVADALPLIGRDERKQMREAKRYFAALYKLFKTRQKNICPSIG